MFWFIPTTHKVVIAALLVVALGALAAFCVTRVVARRRARRTEVDVMALAGVRHRAGMPDPPHETPPAPLRPGMPPPPARPHDE